VFVERGKREEFFESTGQRCSSLARTRYECFLPNQSKVSTFKRVNQTRSAAGRQWYIRSALITSLPDEIINQTVMQFADTPIGCSAYLVSSLFLMLHSLTSGRVPGVLCSAWLFELAGGAIGDFEDTALPKEQRQASFTIAALHQWELGVDDPRCVSSAEEVRLCILIIGGLPETKEKLTFFF
jgi:hypothetical protein